MSNEKTNFKLGDRVMMIQNSEVRYGTIHSFCYDPKIVLVDFKTDKPDECERVKVRVSELVLVQETEAEPKKSEPVEKSEITITADEFKKVGVELILKMSGDKAIVGLTFAAFLAELHKALFFDDVSEKSEM